MYVSAPTYKIGNRPALPLLDVSTTYNAAEKTIYVNVLNRSKDKDIATRIDNQEGAWQAEVGVWEMNHPELKATHSFGDDKKVRPATRTFSASVVNNGFSYTFPAHSLTMLRLK